MKQKTLLAALVISSAALMLSGCGEEKINVNDYLTVDVSGFDTVGKAKAKFDVEKMVEDHLEAFGLKSSNDLAALGVATTIEELLDGKLDKQDAISNGDKVTYKWDTTGKAKLEESYDIKLNLEDFVTEVKTLEKAEEVNPFDYITVTFSGVAPQGEISITKKEGAPIDLSSTKADKNKNLSVGDTVKVTIGGEDAESYKEKCFAKGYIPTELEKEFTVSGLATYVQKLSDMPKDALEKMDAHGQDVVKARVASNNDTDFVGMELLGNYLLTPKDPSINPKVQNYLYFVYKRTFKDMTTEDPDDTFDCYYYTYFTNVMLLEDGKCSIDLSSMKESTGSVTFGVSSGDVFKRGEEYYSGYSDLDSMFAKQVTAKISQYQYESTVK